MPLSSKRDIIDCVIPVKGRLLRRTPFFFLLTGLWLLAWDAAALSPPGKPEPGVAAGEPASRPTFFGQAITKDEEGKPIVKWKLHPKGEPNPLSPHLSRLTQHPYQSWLMYLILGWAGLLLLYVLGYVGFGLWLKWRFKRFNRKE